MHAATVISRWFFNRCLLHMPDLGAPGGSGATAVTGTISPVGLEFLPGGDMLLGAVGEAPTEEADLPEEWADPNAEVLPDPKPVDPAEVVADPVDPDKPADPAKPDEVVAPVEPTAEEMAAWPEEARTYAERLATEKAAAATELAALKTEKEAIAAELVTAKSGQPAAPVIRPAGANPLFGLRDDAALAAHETLADQLLDWATDNATTGGTMPAALQAALQGRKESEITEPEFFDAAAAKAIRSQAKAMIKQHIPAQREYIRAEADSAAYLREHHPKFVDPKSEEGKIFAAFAAQAPMLKTLAAWPIIMADTVRGFMARTAEEKARIAAKGDPQNPAAKPLVPAAQSNLAPKPAGANRPAGTPSQKPARAASKLSASMTAEELAAS